jgi:hypothetical protein
VLKPVCDREVSEDLLPITAHVVMKRCRGAVRMVIPGDVQGARPARPNATLIKALARAHTWSARLFSARISLRTIAKENGLDVSYVGRLIRLTFLAPDLVDAILQGRQAPDLTLDALLRNLPLEWAAQRTVVYGGPPEACPARSDGKPVRMASAQNDKIRGEGVHVPGRTGGSQ